MIESNKKIKHSDFANQIEECTEKSIYYPNNDSLVLNTDDVEIAFPVIIQSGGEYSLKFSSESNDNNLQFDVIVIMMGVRYKYYCSCLVRTLLINPQKEHQDNYRILYEAFELILNEIVPNKSINSIYHSVIKFFELKASHLIKYLPKNFGFSTGIEFRDSLQLLDSYNQTIIQPSYTNYLIIVLFRNGF